MCVCVVYFAPFRASIRVHAAQVLADLVEAIAGTVFLDCGLSLETLWAVFKPLLNPLLTAASKHPVVALLERCAKSQVHGPSSRTRGSASGSSYRGAEPIVGGRRCRARSSSRRWASRTA